MKIQEQLIDLIGHTKKIDKFKLIRLEYENGNTIFDAIAEDKSVVVSGKFFKSIDNLNACIGLSDIDKMKTLLDLDEYRNGNVTFNYQGEVPCSMTFSNEHGDCNNTYRFMQAALLNRVMSKTIQKKEIDWAITVIPNQTSINRLYFQHQVHKDDPLLQIQTNNNNLEFLFGDESTNNGKMIFASNVNGILSASSTFPIKTILDILQLKGDKVMQISNHRMLCITVTTDIAEYQFLVNGKKMKS